MAKARRGAVLAISCLLLWSAVVPPLAAAPPTVAQMLSFRPKQEGVNCGMPTAQEQEACKVELVTGAKPGSNGWLLRDPNGLPLRRFFDTNGDRQIDVLSYYLNGVEVYREIDSNLNGKIDQYRWLNAGGMKWGMDPDEDDKHRITLWKMISAEEASQESLQAVITHDYARLQALLITDEDLKVLDVSSTEAARIRGIQKQASAKFQSTIAKLELGSKTRWERLEVGPPQCVPGESVGAKHDLIKQAHASVLYENNGKHDWLDIGEMIQVGMAWRLVDAPSPGDGTDGGATKGVGDKPDDPEFKKLLEALKELDRQAPQGQETPSSNPDIVGYNLKRADLIQKILGRFEKPTDRDPWVRQLADCLSAAAQSSPDSDKSSYERLVQLEQQVVKEQPGSALAAYATFREMSADYAKRLSTPGPDFTKVQEQWLSRLAKFVLDFPQAEDTPDALLQLGMVSEFVGKEMEAKKWYQQLTTNFPNHASAPKAQGALRRLDLEGKELELSGPLANGSTFDISRLRDKIVIVYYWASWNQQSVGDFARLKLLLSNYSGRGVELVCINLDNSPPTASALQEAPPGVQIIQPKGLDSPLAVQYGVMVLPNMFLVGRDGKVVSRTVQIGTVEDEIKKLVK